MESSSIHLQQEESVENPPKVDSDNLMELQGAFSDTITAETYESFIRWLERVSLVQKNDQSDDQDGSNKTIAAPKDALCVVDNSSSVQALGDSEHFNTQQDDITLDDMHSLQEDQNSSKNESNLQETKSEVLQQNVTPSWISSEKTLQEFILKEDDSSHEISSTMNTSIVNVSSFSLDETIPSENIVNRSVTYTDETTTLHPESTIRMAQGYTRI